ncbi:MAG: dolichyl-phosphate-mannose-protein mannosyltransferase, partial [Elusimicrobiota bacterium]
MRREEIRRCLLPAILILAALLRVGYGLAHPPQGEGANDPDRYLSIAQSVADSGSLAFAGEPTAERMPAYPL